MTPVLVMTVVLLGGARGVEWVSAQMEMEVARGDREYYRRCRRRRAAAATRGSLEEQHPVICERMGMMLSRRERAFGRVRDEQEGLSTQVGSRLEHEVALECYTISICL